VAASRLHAEKGNTMKPTTTVPREAFRAELKKIINDELVQGDRDKNRRISLEECGYVQGFVRVVWSTNGKETMPIDAIADLAEEKAEQIWKKAVGDGPGVDKKDVAKVKAADGLLGELAARAYRTAELRAKGDIAGASLEVKALPGNDPVTKAARAVDSAWGNNLNSSSNLEMFNGALDVQKGLSDRDLGAVARALFAKKLGESGGSVPAKLPQPKLLAVAEAVRLAAKNVNEQGFFFAPQNAERKEVEKSVTAVVAKLGAATDVRAVKVAGTYNNEMISADTLVSVYLFVNVKTGTLAGTYVREGSM
jgi:hypothetical protein